MKTVQGYMTKPVSFRTSGKMITTCHHVAVFSSGVIKITRHDIRTDSTSFNNLARKWDTIDKIPEGAEFIGNYPADM